MVTGCLQIAYRWAQWFHLLSVAPGGVAEWVCEGKSERGEAEERQRVSERERAVSLGGVALPVS